MRSLFHGRTGRVMMFSAAMVPALCHAQDSSSLHPQDDTGRQAAAVAASAIPPERATSDISRLAGEYSFGNSFDTNFTLEISADGKFLFQKRSYERVLDEASGTLELKDGRVVLKTDKERESWPRGTSNELLPVRWGQRLYLVPADDIAGFLNEINRGVEPVTRGSVGSYFLREGDWDRPVSGKPDVPEGWEERLLDEPITGKVAGLDPTNRWIIDLGKKDGVHNGLQLTAWSPNRREFVTLTVTETGTDTSAVQLVDAPANRDVHGWTVYSRITLPPVSASEAPTVAAVQPPQQAAASHPQQQQPAQAPMQHPLLVQPFVCPPGSVPVQMAPAAGVQHFITQPMQQQPILEK